jgi:hypothetical protein
MSIKTSVLCQSAYLSLVKGFIVSLHRARKTKNASLTKRSFKVSSLRVRDVATLSVSS